MAKQKNILEKLVKKDYNNDLEEVLAKKNYPEEVKNLLQDSLYKTENAYKDYEMVKKNVVSIDEYIKNIINGVKNSCDEIELIRPEIGQRETFSIDKQNKKIVCFPNPRLILYAIAKIQKFDDIIKIEPNFLNYSLTNMMNYGNAINMVEPIRDFNGFSWSTTSLNPEEYYYNLIYQDLIILSSNNLIEEWINKNDDMVDYVDLFNEDLEKIYGKKYQKEIIELLKAISILLEINRNNLYKSEITKSRKEAEKELELMKNKAKYLEEISKYKKKLEKNIKKIDITLNDKEKLSKEYEKRNKDLPLEQKIFSKKVLKNILAKEREDYFLELKKCNDKMNSKNFSKLKKEFEYNLEYLKLVEVQDLDKEILDRIILLQKRVLQALKYKIKNATTREEIYKIIYEIRYFNQLQIDEKTSIGKMSKLSKMLATTKSEAILKAYELKAFKDIFKDKSKNINILKYMFNLKIIRLEDVGFKLIKDGENFVQFFDDDVLDEKFKIDTQFDARELKIRFNKRVKIFDI